MLVFNDRTRIKENVMGPHPGKFEDIRRYLVNARRRVEILAEQGLTGNAPLTWEEVARELGGYISPRIEDRDLILEAASTLALERAFEKAFRESNPKISEKNPVLQESKKIQDFATGQLNFAIVEKALYRAPPIRKKGWSIRLRLQETIARARGKRGQRLEIVGRGENKIGYLENEETLVRTACQKGIPYSIAVEKYGYPTDLIIKKRELSDPKGRRRPTTWLVEVEPSGLGGIPKKIKTLHEALERRFYVSSAPNARQSRALKGQLPEERSSLAIVFYTGAHPTLNEATGFIEDYRRENGITNLDTYLKRKQEKMLQGYQNRVLTGKDQAKILEQQLMEAITKTGHQSTVLASKYPVFWLVHIGDSVFLIDLKKTIRRFRKNPEDITHTPLRVPTPNRRKIGVSLHQNITLPNLEALRRIGALKHVGTLRPALI